MASARNRGPGADGVRSGAAWSACRLQTARSPRAWSRRRCRSTWQRCDRCGPRPTPRTSTSVRSPCSSMLRWRVRPKRTRPRSCVAVPSPRARSARARARRPRGAGSPVSAETIRALVSPPHSLAVLMAEGRRMYARDRNISTLLSQLRSELSSRGTCSHAGSGCPLPGRARCSA